MQLALSSSGVCNALRCGEFESSVRTLYATAIAGGARQLFFAHDDNAALAAAPLAMAVAELQAARALDDVALAMVTPLASGDAVVAWVERTLRQTRLEVLPHVLLAVPQQARGQLNSGPWLALSEAMGKQLSRGTVLRWGVALEKPADADAVLPTAATAPFVESFSVPFNIFSQAARAWLGAAATAEPTKPTIVTSPLASGLLAGHIGAGALFHRLDPRAKRWSDDDLQRISLALARLARQTKQIAPAATSTDAGKQVIEAILHDRAKSADPQTGSLLEMSLRFVASSQATIAAVGPRNIEQWRACLALTSNGLVPPLTAELAAALAT